MAEAGGFSTVWIGEHHSMEYTISPSPMPLLAYLAGQTSTIRLGAGTIIAPFWNPIRVAGECALLDVISNGRMEVGLARGAYQFEFDRMARRVCPPPTAASTCANWCRRCVSCGRATMRTTARSGSSPPPPACPSRFSSRPRRCGSPRATPTHTTSPSRTGCNVMVTPLMKGDEEVVDLEAQIRHRRGEPPGGAPPGDHGAAPHPRAFRR